MEIKPVNSRVVIYITRLYELVFWEYVCVFIKKGFSFLNEITILRFEQCFSCKLTKSRALNVRP